MEDLNLNKQRLKMNTCSFFKDRIREKTLKKNLSKLTKEQLMNKIWGFSASYGNLRNRYGESCVERNYLLRRIAQLEARIKHYEDIYNKRNFKHVGRVGRAGRTSRLTAKC